MEVSRIDNITATLYEQDYYLWLEKNAILLRDGRLSELDIANLIEEISALGRSEKRATKSNLIVVIMHLLKYKYQPEERSNSWRKTIVEHRRRLQLLFEDSPSLKGYCLEVFEHCYQNACQDAATETLLPPETFPAESPFTPEEALNPDYLPEL